MARTRGQHCEARTTDGAPCRAYAIGGSRFCFWHSPARYQDAQDARRRGGLVKAERWRLRDEAMANGAG